ncbi:MAG: hypothetical protein GYB67_09355 [Chloroflexi bacterium]|nr:hypothetical protein [Chloroflexota bacterium]
MVAIGDWVAEFLAKLHLWLIGETTLNGFALMIGLLLASVVLIVGGRAYLRYRHNVISGIAQFDLMRELLRDRPTYVMQRQEPHLLTGCSSAIFGVLIGIGITVFLYLLLS